MNRAVSWMRLILLCVLAGSFLLPMYWLIVGSFRQLVGLVSIPPEFFPKEPTLSNYSRLFGTGMVQRWFLNSAIVSGGAVLAACLLSSWTGMALALYEFPGQRLALGAMVAAMATPAFIAFVPSFLLAKSLHIYNTRLGQMMPHFAWPFGVVLMRQYLLGISKEVVDAARADGAGGLALWWHIVLPLSKPVLGVLAVLAFKWSWGNWIWAGVMVRDVNGFTLPVGVWDLANGSVLFHDIKDEGVAMAGAVLGAIPLFAVFGLCQDALVRGLQEGAIR